ncbi:hypothetical protein GR160_11250 [Flavobacterium sp. Sd200]|uniref:hypothetical protein n=1 Tax=Flavobacterium sp. Sd200 TaxID=2692211 RepID=UPI00136C11F3|nr:hypothetical protein [Flavobacterium sp. Sd200]MXN91802.1 hypothetical protein [Flavobacterium sp. Sd200]
MKNEEEKNTPQNISGDFWDELPNLVKQLIDESIEQSIKGNVRPHEEVIAELKKMDNIA